jgi:hypothetical protein
MFAVRPRILRCSSRTSGEAAIRAVAASECRTGGAGELRALGRVMLVEVPENRTGLPTMTSPSVAVTGQPADGSGSASDACRC